jgi:hypothetical protein
MSEYQRLINQIKGKPGRPRLSEEQKQQNRQEQKIRNSKRVEARRRTYLVLKFRHQQEFDQIFASELAALENSTPNATVSV